MEVDYNKTIAAKRPPFLRPGYDTDPQNFIQLASTRGCDMMPSLLPRARPLSLPGSHIDFAYFRCQRVGSPFWPRQKQADCSILLLTDCWPSSLSLGLHNRIVHLDVGMV